MRRSVLDLLIAQAASLVSSLLVTVVTAAVLGTEGRGEVAFVLAVGNLAAAIAFGSLHMSVIHAEEKGHGDARRQGLYIALISAVATFVGLAAAAGLLRHSDGALAEQLLFAGFGGFLGTINLFVLRLTQALGDDARFRNAWAIQGSSFGILGCLAVLITHRPRDVFIAWFVSMIFSTIFSARGVTWFDTAGDRAPRHRLIFDAWSAHLGTLGLQILNRFNIVALGIWSTPSEVGLYLLAAPIAEATWILSEALSLLAFRTAARLGRHEVRRSGIVRQLAVTWCAALGIALVASAVIPVLLPDFRHATILIFILLPGVVLQGLARVTMAKLAGEQRNGLMVRIGLGSAAISSVYVVAANHGALGMAITASALYAAHGLAVLSLAGTAARSGDI